LILPSDLADIYTLPPLFRARQRAEAILPKVGGGVLVRYAFSENGCLWIWRHEFGGLYGLMYIISPILGLLYGAGLALLIVAVRWVRGVEQDVADTY